MILLVDIGNTAVKAALMVQGGLRPVGGFHHKDGDFTALADDAWQELQAPAKVVVANVAGHATGDLFSAWSKERWHVEPVFVRATENAYGVTNAYARPADLGADRWAALVGACASTREAACVVDCGTAVTLDFLAASGDHLGGLILPGVAMLERMLLNTTADIDFSRQPQLLRLFAGRTGDAVQSGAVYMVTAAIDRIITDMAGAAGNAPEVIISGGDASRIQPLLACDSRHDPELVLKGLAIFSGET